MGLYSGLAKICPVFWGNFRVSGFGENLGVMGKILLGHSVVLALVDYPLVFVKEMVVV